MGTSIELELCGVSLDYSKNQIGLDHGFLFQDRDRTHCDAEQRAEFYELHPDISPPFSEAAFVRSLKDILPRINILGFTLEAARAEYEALVRANLELYDLGSDERPNFMSFLQFCNFCRRYPLADLDNEYSDDDEKSRGRFKTDSRKIKRIPPREDDLYWSERSFFAKTVCILSPYAMLQVFALNPNNLECDVVWRYGPLVSNGWAKWADFVAGARRQQSILVATEGSSDAQILRRSLDILQPNVADFFRFIDVNESHPFWGASNLVKFAEGLVRIDVQNRVIFLLDNDAEGVDAYRKLQNLQMPANMRAMVLPRISSFRNFPARGPEGLSHCDINGRAAAIECYLDLRLPNYGPPKVLWTNYKSDLDVWHGALEHKGSYMKFFLEQTDEALTKGAYDTSKLSCILEALLAEAKEPPTGL